MSKWVKKKNKQLRESDDFIPFEQYKATRPKSKPRKSIGTFVHVSAEPILNQFGQAQTDCHGNTILSKGVTFKLPKAENTTRNK